MVWDSPLISNVAASFGVDPGKIRLHGNKIVEDREILSLLNPHGRESLLRFSSPQIRRRIEEIPWVRRVTVKRLFPRGMAIRIEERQPVAFLHLKNRIKLVDAEGVVLTVPLGAHFQNTLTQHDLCFQQDSFTSNVQQDAFLFIQWHQFRCLCAVGLL